MKALCPLVIASLIFVGHAGAALGADDDAEKLVLRGLELRRAGDHQQALDLFKRANAIEPSPMIVAQMGLAEQSLKLWLDSSEHLSMALAATSFPWIRKNRLLLRSALGAVEKHIGELFVSGTPQGAEVMVDGSPKGTLPLASPIRVAEGSVALEVRADGYHPYQHEVLLTGSASAHVQANLLPLGERTPDVTGQAVADLRPSDDSVPTSWTARRIGGIGIAAGGVVAVAIGAWLLHLDGRNACSPPPGGVCREQYATAKAGWAAIAGGVAAGISGTILSLPVGTLDLGMGSSSVALRIGGRL